MDRRKAAMENFMFKDYRSPGAHIVRCLVLILTIAFFIGCSGVPDKGINKADGNARIANPASVNCINMGGRLSIQKRADGGEYGICIFKNNSQCEEWALFRGECSAGGKKVTGIPVEKPPLVAGKSIGNLHMHTTCSDGKNSYEEMVQKALSLKFSFIAITDHVYGGSVLCEDVIRQCREEKRLLCIPSMEVTGKAHLLAIGIQNSINKRLPVKKQVEEIHRQGGIAIAAHPFRSKSPYTESELFETGMDATECKGIPLDQKMAFFDKIREHDIPCVSNSDAHNVSTMEASWVMCDGEIRNFDDLKAAMKEKRCGW
jgi:putative hemolysin/predicted metal-dependent phosphoesterase TrpH